MLSHGVRSRYAAGVDLGARIDPAGSRCDPVGSTYAAGVDSRPHIDPAGSRCDPAGSPCAEPVETNSPPIA